MILNLLSNFKLRKKIFKVMKLSLFLLFVGMIQLSAISVNGQKAVIQVSSAKMSIEQFLKEVENQTNYLVIFSNREIDVKKEVVHSSQTGSVSEYLDNIFAGTNVRHEFENDYIILTKQPISSFSTASAQQAITITGTVVDENGDPIPGVNEIGRASCRERV